MQKLMGILNLKKSKLIQIQISKEILNQKALLLGGQLKGNVNADKIKIKKSANIEGVLNQKTLSIEEGAILKIKTETYK